MQPRQRVALLILGTAAVLAGGVLYAHRDAPPSCGAPQTLDRVTAALQAQSQLSSIVLGDVHTLSDGFFGTRYDCAAVVAELRGGVSASAMQWRTIRYSSARPGPSPLTVVSVTIGKEVPLPPPVPTWWQRLRGWF